MKKYNMKLNFLTNENKNLETKMRFFADYFLFANKYMGRLPGLNFENPVSLLDKIAFQLENNFERCPKSISMYMRMLDAYPHDFMDKLSAEYGPFFREFKRNWQGLGSEKKQKEWLSKEVSLQGQVQSLRDEIDAIIFDYAHGSLYRMVQCEHPLTEHSDAIKFHTNILVSVYKFKGFGKSQIEKFIRRIVSKNKYDFPLPISILKADDAGLFDEQCKDFFKNMGFKCQFEGLKNILDAYKHNIGYFIFPVSGILLRQDVGKEFMVKFEEVSFLSTGHTKLKKLKARVKRKDKENKPLNIANIFFKKGGVVGIVKLNYERLEEAARIGRSKVMDELKYLTPYLNSVSIAVQNDDFLYSTSLDGEDWHAKVAAIRKYAHVHLATETELNDIGLSPFEVLKQNNGKATADILYNERVFTTAYNKDDVSAYWLYIEILFWKNNIGKREVREKFKRLTGKVLPEILGELSSTIAFLFNTFHVPDPEKMIGIGKDEAIKISKDLAQYSVSVNFDWKKILPGVTHFFLNDIISHYLQLKSDRTAWDVYFSDLVQELSDYRNAELHTGATNSYSRVKLKECLKYTMSFIRWHIIRYAQQRPEADLSKLIDELTS
jgi:hypothetical protein